MDAYWLFLVVVVVVFIGLALYGNWVIAKRAKSKKPVTPPSSAKKKQSDIGGIDKSDEIKIIGRRAFWQYVGGIYAVLLLIAVVLWFFPIQMGKMEWNWGLALLYALIFYTVASCSQTVDSTELGARYFLDKPIDQVSSGFVFVPALFCTLKTDTRNVIQDELPADPEKIWRAPETGGDGKVPPGMFPPIRVTFGPPGPNDGIPKDDPYNMRMTAEVVPVVIWEIKDYIRFRAVVGSIKEARKQMADTAATLFNALFANMTPAAAMKGLDVHSETLRGTIDDKVEHWGINLRTAEIKAINYSHALNTAVLSIPKATVTAKATVIDAEGKKTAQILAGEGKGGAEKATLIGRTEGLKTMASELDLKGREVLAAETARGITDNPGQKTIIVGSGGFKDLATVGAVLGESLSNKMEVKNA